MTDWVEDKHDHNRCERNQEYINAISYFSHGFIAKYAAALKIDGNGDGYRDRRRRHRNQRQLRSNS